MKTPTKYLIIATTLICEAAFASNNINTVIPSNNSICAGATIAVNYVVGNNFNNGNVFTAELSSPNGDFYTPVTIGSVISSNSGTIKATIPANTTSSNNYKIRVTGSSPFAIGNDNGASISIIKPNGDPSLFGNKIWNVYCYNGDLSTASATYYGMYTENNLNFNSKTRYLYSSSSSAVPSNANALSGDAYTGYSPIGTVHSVSYKRKGFENGYYQIDVPALDDNGYLTINGTLVWKFIGCCQSHSNVWSGILDSTSTIEFTYINRALGSVASITITNPEALPVSLIDFKAYQNGNNGIIEWTSASEANNEVFIVEKSSNGINYEIVATINGAHNSNTAIHYSTADINLNNGTTYYRLTQVDVDGKSQILGITKLANQSLSNINIYPNPASHGGQINIALENMSEEISISMNDLNGKNIYTSQIDTKNANAVTINLQESVAPGFYFIAVSYGNTTNNYKIQIQ